MSFNKPFRTRAPDYRQVAYEFTYATEAAAQAAHDALRNKMYTVTDAGDYVLSVGRRIKSRDEALAGAVVTFVGQLKASELELEATGALEQEVAGAEGAMTGKTVLA